MLADSAEGTITIGALGLVGAASSRMTVLYTAAWCAVAVALVFGDRKTWQRGPDEPTAVAQATPELTYAAAA